MTDDESAGPGARPDRAGRGADREPIPGRYDDRPLLTAVDAEVRRHLAGDSSGHDRHHAWRVLHLATGIARRVPGDVDEDVLGVAALVHDVHRSLDGGVDPRESLPKVEAILEDAGAPEELVPAICHCVAVHDDYDYRGDPDRVDSTEAAILQDADNLDAMGAVGIARNFAFTAVHDNPLWDPTGAAYSGLYHFEDKLLELPAAMNTDVARRAAERRAEFLRSFRDRFEREWFGEDLLE